MTLFEMLHRCVSAEYTHVLPEGDFALDYSEGSLYIYFEKSRGASDWTRNLDFPAVPYKRMGTNIWLAHRGFLKVWKMLEDRLSPILLDRNIKSIVPIGYSHGAALATLCHEYLWWNREDLRQKLRGFGFGSPRVIWGNVSKRYRERWAGFTVIRCEPDLVTYLPPASFGYFHVGNMLKIGGRVKYSPIEAHRHESYLESLAAEGYA